MTEQLEQFVESAGVLAPLVFVLAYAVLTVGMVPGSLLTVAAGALFGPVWGSVLTIIGASIGAMGAFAAARRLGRARVERRMGKRSVRIDGWLTQSGFRAMLILRLLPVVPFNVVNYAAGLTAIRPRDYALATVIGIVPGTVAFVALGSSLSDPGSPAFWGSLGAVVALILVTAIVQRRSSTVPPEPEVGAA